MSLLQRLVLCLAIPSCLAQTIDQNPPLIVSRANIDVEMECQQVTTKHDYMYWYHQGASRELKYIAYIIRGQDPIYDDKYKDKSVYEVKREEDSTYLKIKSPTDQHEGVYYCASSVTR